MPPTFAAARNTACGRAFANQANTAAWSRKSTSLRPTVSSSTSSRASRRTSARPTIPLCPATRPFLPSSATGVLAIGDLPPRNREVSRYHLLDQLREARLRFPAELLARLAGVADQKIDFSGTEIHGIDGHHGLAGFCVDAGLLDALAAPFDAAADLREGEFDKLAHRAGFARRQHEILGLIRLQDHVHALDIISGMAPVAFRFEISEVERVFQTGLDAGDAARDLARHKGLAADRAFMIEQDAVRGEHAVGLAVVHRYPVTVELGDAVRRARIERPGLPLRNLLDPAGQFRGPRLV